MPSAVGELFRPVRPGHLHLHLRRRVRLWPGAEEWREVHMEERVPVAEAALLLCDVWNDHWCRGAARRVEAMAPRMDQVAAAARRLGVQVIHAPSETVGFYADTPQRRRMLAVPRYETPAPLELPDPPLPIDDSDGGCDSGEPPWHRAWTRQHPAITIAEPDVISDQGVEIYSLLRHLGITYLLIMGVHTNMCVLHRSFGIKPMTRWGVRCVLLRDLTDAMYNPAMPPHVSHDEGTALVVEYIERHWCPTILAEDILRAAT